MIRWSATPRRRQGWSRRSPVDIAKVLVEGAVFAGCLAEIIVGTIVAYVWLGGALPR